MKHGVLKTGPAENLQCLPSLCFHSNNIVCVCVCVNFSSITEILIYWFQVLCDTHIREDFLRQYIKAS